MKLLVIEDSERLRRSLGEGLRRTGFTVDQAADGREGLAFAGANRHDVIILDLMLPEIDGITLLNQLRKQGNTAHILILSAKDQVHDRIRGLEAGADDYLIKPFSFEELCARLRALIRRRYNSKAPLVTIGPIKLDTSRRLVFCSERPLCLTRSEYALLEYLVLQRGRVLSKAQLADRLYGIDSDTSSNTIEVLISTLRRKLRAAGAPSCIETRRGFGYVVE